MIKFNMDIPRDFGDQLRRELEKKLADSLHREGIYDVTVKVDGRGEAVFSGSDASLKRVEAVLDKL